MAAVKVTGEDTLSYLQGQFSQELREGKAAEASYGFWLNRKGKVEGDAVVVRLCGELCYLFSWSLRAEVLIKRLEAFIIADDVELENQTADWKGWQVVGKGVAQWREEAVAARRAAGELEFGWKDPMPWGAESGCLVGRVIPDWPEGWMEGAMDEFERARLAAAVPRVPIDLGEGDLPQEAGMQDVGVCFTKGCYLGQEVMARLRSLGRVRRRLLLVGGEGAAPEPEMVVLRQAEKKVGELRSRISTDDGHWFGLAMISMGSWDPDKTVYGNESGAREIWVKTDDERREL
ncbi:MAG: hypothetical protein J6386_22325 [Candidatus Synoicihabitans palmerolidicus]|nr:hypothetical protein [Candidatus Synoicihabitans palmerolidicus]